MKMQLLSILILLPFLAVAQQNEIYAVKFDFHHSLRIPDNEVSVYFERYGDSINVSVKSIPMDTISQEWKESKRMYSFGVSLTEFQTV